MRKLIVADNVRASRIFFFNHVSRHPQVEVRGRFGAGHITPYDNIDASAELLTTALSPQAARSAPAPQRSNSPGSPSHDYPRTVIVCPVSSTHAFDPGPANSSVSGILPNRESSHASSDIIQPSYPKPAEFYTSSTTQLASTRHFLALLRA